MLLINLPTWHWNHGPSSARFPNWVSNDKFPYILIREPMVSKGVRIPVSSKHELILPDYVRTRVNHVKSAVLLLSAASLKWIKEKREGFFTNKTKYFKKPYIGKTCSHRPRWSGLLMMTMIRTSDDDLIHSTPTPPPGITFSFSEIERQRTTVDLRNAEWTTSRNMALVEIGLP